MMKKTLEIFAIGFLDGSDSQGELHYGYVWVKKER